MCFCWLGRKNEQRELGEQRQSTRTRANFVLFSRSQTPNKLLDIAKIKVPCNCSARWVTRQHSPVCSIHLGVPHIKLGGQHRKGSVNMCWLGRWMGNACVMPQGSSCRRQRQWKEKSLPRAGAPARAWEFCLDWPWKDKKNQSCSLQQPREAHWGNPCLKAAQSTWGWQGPFMPLTGWRPGATVLQACLEGTIHSVTDFV